MWEPFGRIEELKFDLKEDLEIYINYLKIRKKTINEMIPKIDNLHFVDLEEIRTFNITSFSIAHRIAQINLAIKVRGWGKAPSPISIIFQTSICCS